MVANPQLAVFFGLARDLNEPTRRTLTPSVRRATRVAGFFSLPSGSRRPEPQRERKYHVAGAAADEEEAQPRRDDARPLGAVPRHDEGRTGGFVGWARVEHFDCDYCFVRDRGGSPPPGRRCARLIVYDEVVMTDSADERYSNLEVVRNAHGRVLLGGLGLGMILHPIAAKPQVTSVTVLEVNRDVIELVGPTVPSYVDAVPRLRL